MILINKKLKNEKFQKELSTQVETVMRTPLSLIQTYIRPAFKTNTNFFQDGTSNHVFLEIDRLLNDSILRTFKSVEIEDSVRRYGYFKTGRINTNIYFNSQIAELSSLEEILVTAANLVTNYVTYWTNTILFSLVSFKQSDISIGYCNLQGNNGKEDIYCVFLRLFAFKHYSAEKAKFSLHCVSIPHNYEPFSHLLVKYSEI